MGEMGRARPFVVRRSSRVSRPVSDCLMSWTLGGASQSYSYDAIGNLTGKAGIGATYGANDRGTPAGR